MPLVIMLAKEGGTVANSIWFCKAKPFAQLRSEQVSHDVRKFFHHWQVIHIFRGWRWLRPLTGSHD